MVEETSTSVHLASGKPAAAVERDVDDSSSTITGASRLLVKDFQPNHEDIKLLAASAQITEASYSVSDIQTRIFEIQELRHQDIGSSAVNGSSSSTSVSTIIDQALIGLDQRLESAAQNIALITSALEPFSKHPDVSFHQPDDLPIVLLRKHDALLTEWEGVQREAISLRDELKEDKWLLVFRNASDQADGMMNSLERVVDQCQSFVDRLHEYQLNAAKAGSPPQPEMAVFSELQKSLQAKEKYYVPSVSKVLSVLDKGVKIRATKNGESLRRHADMRIRWKALRERITEIDLVMETIARLLVDGEVLPSDGDSTVSRATNLDTPDISIASSSTSALTRSVSPFRKLVGKITRPAGKDPGTPDRTDLPISSPQFGRSLSRRASSLHSRGAEPYGASARPPADALKATFRIPNSRAGADELAPNKPPTIKQTTPSPRRPSSSLAWSAPGPRSVSRLSQSRSVSAPRAQIPSRPQSDVKRPSSRLSQRRSDSTAGLVHTRPHSPSQIPAPNFVRAFSEGTNDGDSDDEVPTSLLQRAMTPSFSVVSNSNPNTPHTKRQSLLPLPKAGLRAPSPSFSRAISPSMSLSGAPRPANELMTPTRPPRSSARPKPAPSSYNSAFSVSQTPSRPSSRPPSRSVTPVSNSVLQPQPYVPGNSKDPLDVEVATVVNSIEHTFTVDRVDPHWRRPPPPGEEIKAQYAFSNRFGRKVLTCKLLVIQRAAPKTLAGHIPTKKVMCRVGGGWQDLETFLINHSL